MSPEKFAEAVDALVHATTAVAQCGMLHCPRCLPKYDAARQLVLDAHAEVVKRLAMIESNLRETERDRNHVEDQHNEERKQRVALQSELAASRDEVERLRDKLWRAGLSVG